MVKTFEGRKGPFLSSVRLQVNKTGYFVGLSNLYFLREEVNKINRGFVYLDGRGCRPGFLMSADIRGSASDRTKPPIPVGVSLTSWGRVCSWCQMGR